MRTFDVIIVGAGPAGLATAIAARRHGLSYQLFEKGTLVNSILHYPTYMTFFTTAELLEIGGLPFVTPYEKPTRLEALRYYRRVADSYELEVAFDEEVRRIVPRRREEPRRHEEHEANEEGPRRRAGREGHEEDAFFVVETRTADGVARVTRGRTVVVATGAYDLPNRLHVPGEDLPHVSHYYREPHAWFRKPVVVVGGRNSAAEAALDLYRAGARVTLVHRRPALSPSIKYWVLPDIENRLKEGSIQGRFSARVVEIRPRSVVLERVDRPGATEELPAEGVFLLTGYRPETKLLAEAGVRIAPETCAPAHHPETFETNVPGLYLAGAVIAGTESGRIFIENGRFHGEQVIRAIRERITGGE